MLRSFWWVRVVVLVVRPAVVTPPSPASAPPAACTGRSPGCPPLARNGAARRECRLEQLGEAAHHVRANVFLSLLEPGDQLVAAPVFGFVIIIYRKDPIQESKP